MNTLAEELRALKDTPQIEYVIGVDEAGRGCLAGPVSVAAACFRLRAGDLPFAVDDSKAIPETERARVYGVIMDDLLGGRAAPPTPAEDVWCRADGAGAVLGVCTVLVPHTTVDAVNILNATLEGMALAADTLLAAARAAGLPLSAANTALLIDGNRVPWTLQPAEKREAIRKKAAKKGNAAAIGRDYPALAPLTHRTVVGGDGKMASIAAASVVAKVRRDAYVTGVMHPAAPAYGFDAHKGYATPAHRRALAELGPCAFHRLSYKPVQSAIGTKRPRKE